MNLSFRLDHSSGLLEPVRVLLSPNCDDRPHPGDISLLVIHGISLPPGRFGGDYIDQLFTNQLDSGAHPYFMEIHQLRVSSHLLIRRDGAVTQYVPLHRRAWHAGQSEFRGRTRCNDFSIGIELEGTDDVAYDFAQYLSLAAVSRLLLRHFPLLNKDTIAGHSDIAPGRKTDPGPAFDWKAYRKLLDHE